MESAVFTPREMAQLSMSFTGEEIQQIENKQFREALDDAIEKYGQSRAPLTKTFSTDDLTGNLILWFFIN